MIQGTRAGDGSVGRKSSRWWRVSEQAWYTQVLAVLTLVATAFAVFFGVLQIWPDPEPSKTVKNNYAIVLDRSESMGEMLGDTTKLESTADTIIDAVEEGKTTETARGLTYFGGGCGRVDESVNLAPNNASQITTALESPPRPRGERPLIHALDAAVNEFANVPSTLGTGAVRTVRRIVVFTDGPDECGDDLSRVTTSLYQSGIQLEFHIVGIDLSPADQQGLTEVAQSLPGVGGEPAEVKTASDDLSLNNLIIESFTFIGPDETIPTPKPPADAPLPSAPPASAPSTTTGPTTATTARRG
jgi:hypothetical protein